jgi:hypothetical protein
MSKPIQSKPTLSRRRLLLFRFVLLAVALGLGVFFSEIALRLSVDRLPPALLVYLPPALKDRFPQTWDLAREYVPFFNIRQADAELGWTLAPARHIAGTNEDGQPYDVTFTPDGLFTPDTPAPGDPQIITLGDSFLSTFYVPQPIAWQLRQQLDQPVLNLASPGWGIDNLHAAYRRFAPERQHELVVVFSFLNDITDAENWSRWQANSSGQDFMTWLQHTFPDQGYVNCGQSFLDRHSLVWNTCKYQLARRSLLQAEPQVGLAARQQPNSTLPQRSFSSGDGESFELQLSPGLPFAQMPPAAFLPGGQYFPYLETYFRRLAALQQTIAQQGARMLLVWIPAKERVYLPVLPADQRAPLVDVPDHDLSGLESALAVFAREMGISLLDLTEPLIERARAGEKLYFTVDGHLNAHGNEIVGNLAAECISHLEAPPVAVAVKDRTMLLPDDLQVTAPLQPARCVFRAPFIEPRSQPLLLQGVPDAPYAYLLTWPTQEVPDKSHVVVRGTLRRGGITIGLQQNDAWVSQKNVVASGPFSVSLPVPKGGSYQVVIANCSPDGPPRIDGELATIGWSLPADHVASVPHDQAETATKR